jgi:ElaB/YqjD/DUF883 family membrane-anchored ribosome-binding protein
MELYYKDLISKDSSLEKLVDNLMLVVQGAEEFAEANGATLDNFDKEELTSRLQQLKASCLRVREHAVQGAVAADKFMHRYPYSAAGIAFAVGLLAAGLLSRRR